MAYTCVKSMNHKECDGCQECMKKERVPETGVLVEATINMTFTAYGRIEEFMRSGSEVKAKEVAEELVQDAIDCCGLAGQDMTIGEIEITLNE